MTGACLMHLVRLFRALIAATVAVATIWGVPACASTVTRKGTFHITGRISLGPNVTNSQTLRATAFAAVNVSTGAFYSSESTTAVGTVKRSGDTATVTIDLPYTWVLDSSAVSNARVDVELDVYTSDYASLAQTQLYVELPANNATTRLAFTPAI